MVATSALSPSHFAGTLPSDLLGVRPISYLRHKSFVTEKEENMEDFLVRFGAGLRRSRAILIFTPFPLSDSPGFHFAGYKRRDARQWPTVSTGGKEDPEPILHTVYSLLLSCARRRRSPLRHFLHQHLAGRNALYTWVSFVHRDKEGAMTRGGTHFVSSSRRE
jgi:hypothetical protein